MTARALVLLLSCQLSTALLAPARRLRTPQSCELSATMPRCSSCTATAFRTYTARRARDQIQLTPTVAPQLARRVGHFDAKVSGTTDAAAGDVVIGLGVTDASKTKATLARLQPSCFVADDECSSDVKALAFCAGWMDAGRRQLDKLQKVLPFTTKASRARCWRRAAAPGSRFLRGRARSPHCSSCTRWCGRAPWSRAI